METLQETQLKKMDVNTHLFDEEVYLKEITEFGLSWQELLTGQLKPPVQGARFNVAFEGRIDGPYLSGIKKGVDFLLVRADGQFIIDLQAVITTPEGDTISVHEEGLLIPDKDSPTGQLKLTMRFNTASPGYSWLNEIQAWATGKVDMLNGTVRVSAFK